MKTLANLHSCDDMGICLMRTPPCQEACTAGKSREMLPRIDLDDADPVLRADGCMRIVWLIVCVGIGALVAGAALTLLWRHDVALRGALLSARDALLAMYWASLASMY